MIRGLYTSASGMFAGQQRMDVTAHNIANVQTAGFKRQTAHFAPYKAAALVRQDRGVRGVGATDHGVRLDALRTEISIGPLVETGRPEDLALLSGGFFCLEGRAGEVFYTRAGHFRRDDQGYLATDSGLRLLGEGGPLHVGDGEFTVDTDGRVYADGENIGRLRVALFADPTALRREGKEALFSAGGAPEDPAGGPIIVRQGYLEESNVNLATEMVEMIKAARIYAANQRMVSTHDSLLEKAVNQVGLVR